MNTEINYTEDYFSSCLQNDKLLFNADSAIHEKLRNTLGLKAKKSEAIRFFPKAYFKNNFSLRGLSYKAGMAIAASLLLFMLLKVTINQPNLRTSPVISDSSFCDSVNVGFYSTIDSCVKNR